MPTLDITTLLTSMTTAAEASLKSNWPGIRDLATTSLNGLAHALVDIELMKLNGTVTDEQANLLLDMQKNTLKIVLLSEAGLGLLAVEAAINAVLDSIKTVVNTAVRFPLI